MKAGTPGRSCDGSGVLLLKKKRGCNRALFFPFPCLLLPYGRGQLFRQLPHAKAKRIGKLHKRAEPRLSKAFLYDGEFPCVFVQALGKGVLREADTLSFLNDERPEGMWCFVFHIAKA